MATLDVILRCTYIKGKTLKEELLFFSKKFNRIRSTALEKYYFVQKYAIIVYSFRLIVFLMIRVFLNYVLCICNILLTCQIVCSCSRDHYFPTFSIYYYIFYLYVSKYCIILVSSFFCKFNAAFLVCACGLKFYIITYLK